MAITHRLPLQCVVEAVIDSVQRASRDTRLPVRLIGIMSRTFGEDACWQELEAILACRGSEFLSHFARAHDAGLRITVHAGEPPVRKVFSVPFQSLAPNALVMG